MAEQPVGEVIESTTTQFKAQCSVLHDPPALGTFARIGDRPEPFADLGGDGTIYGLVHWASTASIEPNRRPAAFGLDAESLRREQPQIYELLATDFACLIVGHVESGRLLAYLPPKPPMLHAQVSLCSDSEVCALTERMDYLRAVIDSRDCPACDEVIAASLRVASRCRQNDPDYLIRAGTEVAMLLREEYDRLSALLRKIGHVP